MGFKDEVIKTALKKGIETASEAKLDKANYAADVYNAINVYNEEYKKTGDSYAAAEKAGQSLADSYIGGKLSETALDMVVDNMPAIGEGFADFGTYAPVVAFGVIAGYIEYQEYKDGTLPENPYEAQADTEDKGMQNFVEKIVNWFEDSKDSSPEKVDPLAIDLDMDGVETVSTENGVYFDLDKNGYAEKTEWTFSMNSEQLTVNSEKRFSFEFSCLTTA